MNTGLRVVFMGTPEFAEGVLQKIVESKHTVVAIVTAPDRPAGRGQKIKQSAVKTYAIAKEIEVHQPMKLKSTDFINALKSYEADLFVVVAFRMLPEVVWSLPKRGTINLHASSLPNYRGAAPINWAIINGETKTGATTFFINERIDTGDIIKNIEVVITEQMNAGDLHDVLMEKGASLVTETINALENNEFIKQNQSDLGLKELKIAPKIFKNDCKIDWSNKAKVVHNKIRGLSPNPGAWCKLYNKPKDIEVQFKLLSSTNTQKACQENDKNLQSSEHGILFPCMDFYLCINELQMEGKRRMNFKEFLAGNSIEEFSLIEE